MYLPLISHAFLGCDRNESESRVRKVKTKERPLERDKREMFILDDRRRRRSEVESERRGRDSEVFEFAIRIRIPLSLKLPYSMS